jgi:amino acid transporter
MASHEIKSEGFSSEAPVKPEHSTDEAGRIEEGGLSDPNHVDLHRALKARHITMIGT